MSQQQYEQQGAAQEWHETEGRKMSETPTGLALLRVQFPPHHISKLPKPTKAQTDAVKADYKAGIRCQLCQAWHHPQVVHLDYVGHAALTDRLLDTDPAWSWEPLAMSPAGLPVMDPFGGMWIKLTVCGVTRLGYGHAGDKQGGDAIKEIIGDALRNAAMRFGAALDLWHKGDLHVEEDKQDVAAILRGITNSASVEVLKANYEAAMQMLDAAHHQNVMKAKNARLRELKVTA
jgi:hypothetical protein